MFPCLAVRPSIRPSVRPSIRPSVRPSIRPSKSFPLLVDLFEAAWRDTTLKLFLIDYLGVKSVDLGGSREILSWGKLRFSSTKLRRDMCIFGSISVNFGRTIILDAGLTGQSSVLNRLRVVLKQLEYQKSDIQQKWSWNWPQNGKNGLFRSILIVGGYWMQVWLGNRVFWMDCE